MKKDRNYKSWIINSNECHFKDWTKWQMHILLILSNYVLAHHDNPLMWPWKRWNSNARLFVHFLFNVLFCINLTNFFFPAHLLISLLLQQIYHLSSSIIGHLHLRFLIIFYDHNIISTTNCISILCSMLFIKIGPKGVHAPAVSTYVAIVNGVIFLSSLRFLSEVLTLLPERRQLGFCNFVWSPK